MILSAGRHKPGPGAGAPPARDPPAAGPSRLGPFVGPAAFAVAGALLVASAITLNVFLSSLAEARASVLHASSILQDVAKLHLDVRAAETGQRGYVLTGERRYLAPYERAI